MVVVHGNTLLSLWSFWFESRHIPFLSPLGIKGSSWLENCPLEREFEKEEE